MAKVFLSFLGTSPYLPCNYCFGNNKVKNARFIQNALTQLFCEKFTHDDKIIIFMTDSAFSRNWCDSSINDNSGLEKILSEHNTHTKVIPVSIPDGKSEKEIWEIFEIIYKQIEAKDEIILDITHSFRSLPMLNMVLLNYAKFLKDITVKGIYYGAFEALGFPTQVKEIPLSERNAPIFDLTSFSILQDWSNAADHFVNYGKPDNLITLINHETKSIYFNDGDKSQAKQLCELRKGLANLSNIINTVRGQDIIRGKFTEQIETAISNLKPDIKPLQPILQNISEKTDEFKKDDFMNCFHAVDWCINHNLIQQGITILQEGTVSYLLGNLKSHNNVTDEEYRNLTSALLGVKHSKIPRNEWGKKITNYPVLVKQLESITKFNQLIEPYGRLKDLRNDINHCGFRKDPIRAEKFLAKLEQSYKEIKRIIGS